MTPTGVAKRMQPSTPAETATPALPPAIAELRTHYRSGSDDLAGDFFKPCLAHCVAYSRAVGYFSSSALATWSHILPEIARGGREVAIRLLASPALSEGDREALRSAATDEDRRNLLQRAGDRAVLDALQFAQDPDDQPLRLRLLAWMVAAGHLEIRFAYRNDFDQPGLFHEKIGIFSFPGGATVAFTGSANESLSGHSLNYETLDVFRDWVAHDHERVRVKVRQFEDAWSGDAPGLEVLRLSPDALRQVKAIAPADSPIHEEEEASSLDDRARWRWRHQDEAIEEFLSVERGVLEMATGTGKTRTALRICETLLTDKLIDSIIVSADGNDLLDQWYQQLLSLATSGRSFRIARHYSSHHEREYFTLDPSHSILLTSRYALPAALRAVSPAQAHRTILIHDEVHRLGSPANRKELAGLSDHVRFRLGLSATPEREYDQEGTVFVEQHVGPVCYRFGLADAIRRNILSPFNYYPLEYEPDDNDRERTRQVYKRAAAREHSGQPMSKEEIWTELARVHKTSLAKLPVFESFIEQRRDLLERCIIFVETQEYGEAVLRIVHRLRHDFHTYFSGEDSGVLRRFAHGDLECLLTCHRLSEGIDIQDLRTVLLFSSARARLETIQRMGRCLRVNPDDLTKIANVVDFIRIADIAGVPDDDNADQARRDWLNELAAVRPTEDALT